MQVRQEKEQNKRNKRQEPMRRDMLQREEWRKHTERKGEGLMLSLTCLTVPALLRQNQNSNSLQLKLPLVFMTNFSMSKPLNCSAHGDAGNPVSCWPLLPRASLAPQLLGLPNKEHQGTHFSGSNTNQKHRKKKSSLHEILNYSHGLRAQDPGHQDQHSHR